MVKELDWAKIAPHPSCILASGGRGEGKSALLGTYFDYAKSKKLKRFSIGRDFPKIPTKGVTFKPPKNSVIGLDDAHLLGAYAHEANRNIKMWDFLQRQKRHGKHSIFWTTQDTTSFTLRLLRMIDAICLFNPDMMLHEYERPLMQKKYMEASQALKEYSGQYGYVWIQYQDKHKVIHKEVFHFDLPKWYNDKVSTGAKKEKYAGNIFTDVINGMKSIGRAFS